jgi:hypothetical protein
MFLIKLVRIYVRKGYILCHISIIVTGAVCGKINKVQCEPRVKHRTDIDQYDTLKEKWGIELCHPASPKSVE